MPRYVDGFVLVVAKKNLPAYLARAKKAGKIWREFGAMEYRESMGDDLKTGFGVPYPTLLKTKTSETVVYSWIVYKSKSHRKSVNAKMMKDPRVAAMCDHKNLPFDVKRMSCGGFVIKVEA